MSPVSGAVTGQWRNGRYCVCVSMRDWGQSVVREAAAAERKRPGVGVQVGVQADAAAEVDVHRLDLDELHRALRDDGQILERPPL